MAEVDARAAGPAGRRRNRRQALEKAMGKARTPRQVLAAAAAYFRSAFAHVEDPDTAKRLARQLIEMTDRESGVSTDEYSSR